MAILPSFKRRPSAASSPAPGAEGFSPSLRASVDGEAGPSSGRRAGEPSSSVVMVAFDLLNAKVRPKLDFGKYRHHLSCSWKRFETSRWPFKRRGAREVDEADLPPSRPRLSPSSSKLPSNPKPATHSTALDATIARGIRTFVSLAANDTPSVVEPLVYRLLDLAKVSFRSRADALRLSRSC